ncbi:MAG: hypothetical protein HY049_14890 [Acidobacteria bacterium]|nr:hypothetical protein [Acidobacteriota bacterium]
MNAARDAVLLIVIIPVAWFLVSIVKGVAVGRLRPSLLVTHFLFGLLGALAFLAYGLTRGCR